MKEYFVYEDWADDRVRVHEAMCLYATVPAGEGKPSIGAWHGPYLDRGRAFQLAHNLKHHDTAACEICRP